MFLTIIKQISLGSITTLEVFFMTLIFSLPLGLLVALGRMSNKKWINEPVKLYILIMRGTPLLLQIIFIYFGPFYMMPEGMKINMNRFAAAIIAFVLNYAAYFAEIYRGGIESMGKDQYEAAAVLGFTKFQSFFLIILPQVIKRILPALTNEIITLVKDTSLVQIIGISELFRQAQNASSRYFSTTPLLIAGLFYLIMNGIVTKVFSIIEGKLDYYN